MIASCARVRSPLPSRRLPRATASTYRPPRTSASKGGISTSARLDLLGDRGRHPGHRPVDLRQRVGTSAIAEEALGEIGPRLALRHAVVARRGHLEAHARHDRRPARVEPVRAGQHGLESGAPVVANRELDERLAGLERVRERRDVGVTGDQPEGGRGDARERLPERERRAPLEGAVTRRPALASPGLRALASSASPPASWVSPRSSATSTVTTSPARICTWRLSGRAFGCVSVTKWGPGGSGIGRAKGVVSTCWPSTATTRR